MVFINELTYREIVEDYDDEGVMPKPEAQMIKVFAGLANAATGLSSQSCVRYAAPR